MGKRKKYKALIMDVDGTLIHSKRDAMPSKKVTEAINNASKFIHIGIATSRPYFLISHILEHLNLSGPSILSGGSQIINLPEKKFVWEKMVEKEDILKTCNILNKMKIHFLIHDCITDQDIEFFPKKIPDKPGHVICLRMFEQVADKVIQLTSSIQNIAAYKVPSWEKGKVDIMITHSLATKQHAIFEVAKMLGIQTHEIIGVGDGYNDFPLLMACGLKIAMGNAANELKAIADYVAPTVQEDGVADVIEKYILENIPPVIASAPPRSGKYSWGD